jgi:hypothetical protein
MTLIDAERVRDFVGFVETLTAMSADPDYQRGAGEACRMVLIYLDALVDKPDTDRPVAA